MLLASLPVAPSTSGKKLVCPAPARRSPKGREVVVSSLTGAVAVHVAANRARWCNKRAPNSPLFACQLTNFDSY